MGGQVLDLGELAASLQPWRRRWLGNPIGGSGSNSCGGGRRYGVRRIGKPTAKRMDQSSYLVSDTSAASSWTSTDMDGERGKPIHVDWEVASPAQSYPKGS